MSDYPETIMNLLFIFLFIGTEAVYFEGDEERGDACRILREVFSPARAAWVPAEVRSRSH